MNFNIEEEAQVQVKWFNTKETMFQAEKTKKVQNNHL